MYNPKSLKAEEFISHEEIQDTLRYADENKDNLALVEELLAKAERRKGLSHREASVLLACDDEAKVKEIYALAEQIKKDFYGNRIVLFAPLYLSNYCINHCVYCPYHAKNTHIGRKKLTQEEIVREVMALQDMGHKRLALEAGEDPVNNPIEYILECIKTIYSIKHKNGAIRRVNVNIAATTVENYRKLKDAGIGTYILFQETYHKESYEELHPRGPKHNYAYHTEAMDRAMEGGIDDVGIGVLFGLERYRYEFAGLLMHAEHLEAVHGVGPHTISVPRVKHADDIDPNVFDNGIDDEIFCKLIALIRIAVPYTGMIISTRESQAVREKALHLGISQISGASRTSVGGYTEEERPTDTEQFDVSDQRTLDEVIKWLMDMDFIPSFCTACYRAGRTGDRFMELCKSKQIQNCCHPNALMTLKEYLVDYASPETRQVGEQLIQKELENIPKEGVRRISDAIGYVPIRHILNSAGIERFPQYQFDMVRLGIGIYGISALPGVKLSPVASLKVKVLQVKTLSPEDGTIGYGRHGHIAPEGTVTATIPVGYADGVDRHLGRGNASFSVNGKRVPTIGNICMDMCMLDVTGVDVKVGDTVTIFGADPTICELADILGTIPYEILTSVPRRIERIIIRK